MPPLPPVAKPKIGVLFDVDGVIIRNKPLLRKIGKNCTQFINLVNRHKIYPHELEKYNKKLYTEHGHTLKGWLVDNPGFAKQINGDFTLQVFNRYVYNEEVLFDLETYLSSNEFKPIYEEITNSVSICNTNKVLIGLFSNAPELWCNIIADRINIPIENVYSCDHELRKPNMLFKPQLDTYNKISQDIQTRDYKIQELLFIDDSLQNLTTLSISSGSWFGFWKPIYFNPEKISVRKDLTSVENITDVNNLIISKM
jgi:FMN phosphatase YigB (HAD superfamily)